MVYIKRITMRGFKSYGPGEVTMKLDKGLTVISGHNGSGKSNTFDAIQFVLGQRSKSSIRTGKLTDVIFSGTAEYPTPAESAEVTIVFDNSDRRIAYPADEVVVSRYIDRTGKSKYRLNGKVTTSKEITNILGTAGIYADGYNIMLQWKIMQMSSMTSEERREILEEIAGTKGYDAEKERALRKLAEADKILGEVDARLSEAEAQLKRLEVQKEKLQKHKELTSRIRHLEEQIILAELKDLQDQQQTLANELHQIKEKQEQLEAAKAEIAKKREELQKEYELISQTEAGTRLNELNSKKSKLVKEQGKLERKRERLFGELNKFRFEITTLQKQNEELSWEQEDLESKRVSLQEQIERLEKRVSEDQTKLNVLEQERIELKAPIESAKQRLNQIRIEERQLRKKQSSIEANIEKLQVSSEERELKLAELEKEREETEQSLQQIMSRLDSLLKQRDELLAKQKETQRTLTVLRVDLDKSFKKRQHLSEQLQALELKRSKLSSEIEIKLAQKERMQSRNQAVREILKQKEAGNLKGIIGTLSQLLSVPPEFQKAIETAAGRMLDAVIVTNDKVAALAIQHLKRTKSGRCTFIPLNVVKPRKPSKRPKDKSCYGTAQALVDYPNEISNAVGYVLGGVLVFSDLNAARKYIKDKLEMVTLDGDRISASGLMTGGESRSKTSYFVDVSEEEQKIKAIDTQLLELRREYEDLERIIADKSARITKLNDQFSSLDSQIIELRSKIGDLKVEQNIASGKISSISKQISTLQASSKEELEAKLAQLRKEYDEITLALDQLMEEQEELQKLADASQLVELSEEIRHQASIVQQATHELKETQGELNRVVSRLDAIAEQIARNQKRIVELQQSIDDLEEDIPRLEVQIEEIDSEVTRLEATIKTVETESEKIAKRQTEVFNLLKEIQTKESKILNALHQLETAAVERKTKLETIETRMQELYAKASEFDLEISETIEVSRTVLSLKREINKIKKEIVGLGSINFQAERDYEELVKKHGSVVEKKLQLEKDKQAIQDFIEKVEKTKTEKFMEVFNVASKHLDRIFKSLSPNGQASLVLERPDSPFEGGVEIRATPGGKKVKVMSLMSGGEKTLTALAFVFALQQFEAAPFTILDEPDQSLDDVNRARVAELLAVMSKQTQIICVTLHNPIIQKADYFYGVTLDPKTKFSTLIYYNLKELREKGKTKVSLLTEAVSSSPK